MAAVLNRLIGIGAGLAITGAVINSTLYNGMQDTVESASMSRNRVLLVMKQIDTNTAWNEYRF